MLGYRWDWYVKQGQGNGADNDNVNNVDSVGARIQDLKYFSLFVDPVAKGCNQKIEQAQQRKVEAQPEESGVPPRGYNILTGFEDIVQEENNIDIDWDPGDAADDYIQFFTFGLPLKYFLVQANDAQQKVQKIDQQPLILKIDKDGFGPAFQPIHPHQEAIQIADDNHSRNRHPEGNIGQFQLYF